MKLNRQILTIFCAISLVSHAAPVDKALVNQTESGQELFETFHKLHKKNSPKNREALELIDARGLPPSASNVLLLQKLLADTDNVEEQIVLSRLLASQHMHDSDSESNSKIEEALKRLSKSNDRRVATSAAIGYARLGYRPDSHEELRILHNSKKMDDDTYFGELAHLLFTTPNSEQRAMINDIRSNSNQYALEIICSNLQEADYSNRLSVDTKRVILEALQSKEPKFSVSIGNYGITEALAYSDWLHAIASLTAETKFSNYDSEIAAVIARGDTNPKKVIAYLSSDAGKRFMNSVGTKKLEVPLANIRQYAKYLPYPQNADVIELVADIERAANAAKN